MIWDISRLSLRQKMGGIGFDSMISHDGLTELKKLIVMRRISYFLVFWLMACLPGCAKSYGEVFSEAKKSLSFGVHFGAIGQAQDLGLQILVGSVTFYNVYVDFGGWPQAHGSDVRVRQWDEDRAYLFHAGYQVPITSWLRITPMVGYACDETGVTDGSNWSVTDSGIHNKFYADKAVKGFDYGGQVMFSIPVGKKTSFQLMGTYTRFCWYGGLGLGVRF